MLEVPSLNCEKSKRWRGRRRRRGAVCEGWNRTRWRLTLRLTEPGELGEMVEEPKRVDGGGVQRRAQGGSERQDLRLPVVGGLDEQAQYWRSPFVRGRRFLRGLVRADKGSRLREEMKKAETGRELATLDGH
jgi:hypothetical protein